MWTLAIQCQMKINLIFVNGRKLDGNHGIVDNFRDIQYVHTLLRHGSLSTTFFSTRCAPARQYQCKVKMTYIQSPVWENK